MRKLVGVLLAVVLVALCASALAGTDLQALIDASVTATVHETYRTIVEHIVRYDVDTGEVTEQYDAYLVNDPVVGLTHTFTFPDGSVRYCGNGSGYGYFGDSRQLYVCGYIGNAYEETIQKMQPESIGDFFTGQSVTAEENRPDGRLLITLESVIAEGEPYFEPYAGSTLVARHTVRPESLLIESSEICVRGADGAEQKYLDLSVEYEPDILQVELPFDLELITKPAATREIRVILDPGTAAESVCVLSAPLNLPISLFSPKGYRLYQDAACTQPVVSAKPDENGDYPALVTLYCAAPREEKDWRAYASANSIGALHDAHSPMLEILTFYDLDTGEVSRFTEMYFINDPDSDLRYVYLYSDGDVSVLTNDGGYGRHSDGMQLYALGWIGDAHAEILRMIEEANIGEFYDDQIIVSEELSADGKLLLTTEGPVPQDAENYAEELWAQTLVVRYVIDPATLVMDSSEGWIQYGDGAEKLYFTSTSHFGVTPEIPFDPSPITEPKETRQIRVILNPGTDAETEQVVTAPLDIIIYLYEPDGYALFDDAACTVPASSVSADENGHYPQTQTIYCGKK